MNLYLNTNKKFFFNEEGNRIPYSDPGDLFDIEEELNKFTNEYDKKHNINFNSDTAKEKVKEEVKDKTERATKESVKESTEKVIKESTEGTIREGEEKLEKSAFKKIFNKRVPGLLLNTGFAISDYKEARNKGAGVIKSTAIAGAKFAAGELLQGAMLPVMLAKEMPSMIVSGVDSVQKVTRQMNSSQRFQTFGEAEFHDTQQLATMRQAGMEMAKMSQYNLQQSIMGNEAQFMHRI